MPYVLRVAGLAHSRSNELGGTYIQSFDPEANEGRGATKHSYDPKQALRFGSAEEAIAFWKQQSKVKPFRADGQPNCPLTAFHMLVEWFDSDLFKTPSA